MDVTEKIRKYVERECKKQTSKYGYEPYVFHFVPVHDYAVRLAKKLGADLEIVELASWLHDIGSIIHRRKDHHITGAKIAEEKLRELNYPEQKIKLIKKCILNHRGSVKSRRISLEERIIADADGMNNFNNLPGLFKAAFTYENLDQGKARISVRQKLINTYRKISPAAKAMIEQQYRAAMTLLR